MTFETIIHYTVEDRDNIDHVENHGPFPANERHDNYLGHGYYLWDNHLELAHWWGKVHFNDRYYICESDFIVEKNMMLDLVGSRMDQIYLSDVIKELQIEELPLGQVIEVLKGLNQQPNKAGIFPYKAIRAVDVTKTSYAQKFFKFVSRIVKQRSYRKGGTILSPQMFICLIEKNRLLLPTFRVIYPDA